MRDELENELAERSMLKHRQPKQQASHMLSNGDGG